MKTYNEKEKLARHLKEIGGLRTYKESRALLNSFLKTLEYLLVNTDEEINLRGIVTFKKIKRKPSMAYSVQKRKMVFAPETTLISFKRSKTLIRKIKKGVKNSDV